MGKLISKRSLLIDPKSVSRAESLASEWEDPVGQENTQATIGALGKRILKDVCPPILARSVRRNRTSSPHKPDLLFDGEAEAFKYLVRRARVYGEYGIGKSTEWVLRNTDAQVLAVESDKTWIDRLTARALPLDRLELEHVDLGEVAKWGRPVDYSRRSSFVEYTDSVWTRRKTPDVVLIDGRFRVCCFLTALKRAKQGAKIIIDDYTGRPHYHVVEEFCPPMARSGRQCIFEVPNRDAIDTSLLDEYIERFRFVMD